MDTLDVPTNTNTVFVSNNRKWSDLQSVALLFILYIVQGIPFGLIFGSIPFLLKPHVSYAQLGFFSISSFPYALKLLVAPLVDASTPPIPLGRRPGWIVPNLTMAGSIQLLSAPAFDTWITNGRVGILTFVCFCLVCLVAVQEVAVDGWSLELLSEPNRGWASVCQAIGPSIGYTASFTLFLALNDANLCERFIWPIISPTKSGAAISLSGAVSISALSFLFTAMLVTISTKLGLGQLEFQVGEREVERLVSTEQGEPKIFDSYRTFGKVLSLRSVQQLVIVLLVAKLGFSSFDSAAPLKLIDLGFNKELIATIAVAQSIAQVSGTFILGRRVLDKKTEMVFMRAYFARFVLSLFAPIIVYWYSSTESGDRVRPLIYLVMTILMMIYGIVAYCLMYVPITAFFIKVSSTSVNIGGSYLTLLHAAYNIGSMWPKTITLQLVDMFTFRQTCTALASEMSKCPVRIDGYYVVAALEALFALLAGIFISRTLRVLGTLPQNSWAASQMKSAENNDEEEDNKHQAIVNLS